MTAQAAARCRVIDLSSYSDPTGVAPARPVDPNARQALSLRRQRDRLGRPNPTWMDAGMPLCYRRSHDGPAQPARPATTDALNALFRHARRRALPRRSLLRCLSRSP